METLRLLVTMLVTLAHVRWIQLALAQQHVLDSNGGLEHLVLRDDLRSWSSTTRTASNAIDTAALQSILLGAQQQQPESQYLLAMLRLYGHGVEKDPHTAVRLLRSAAEQAHRDAEFALGVLYATGGDGVVAQSDRTSAAWLSKSANRGHTDAKWMLAVLLNEGRGVDENVPRALELLDDAVRAGSPHAQFHMGVMLEYGRGVPQDVVRAADLYERASDAHVPDAMYYLGLQYAQGRGRRQSFARAIALFQRAADTFEHAQAMYALGQMHAHGQGTPVDYSLARAWFERAAERRDPRVSDVAARAASELDAFFAQVEARVREQEAALGTVLQVSVAAIE